MLSNDDDASIRKRAQRVSGMRRFNIVGTSGSGKSTFSRKLAGVLSLPYVEMDTLYWGKNWSEATTALLTERVAAAAAETRWVLDGNYSRTTPVKWATVDCVIWLDFSLWFTLFRSLKRTIVRALSRKELWPGTNNVETLRKSFLSRESILLWTLSSHPNNRDLYLRAMQDHNNAHIEFVRLRSPEEARQFLEAIAQECEQGSGAH